MSESNAGDIFSSLLSNPEMLSNIAKLLSSTQSHPATEAAADEGGIPVGAPDSSALLGSLLSNPQIMAALPKMLGALSSMSKTTPEPPHADTAEREPSQEKPTAPDLSGLGALLPALAGGGGYKKPPRPTDRRSALLLALKPYMSQDKGEMIDTIVRIIEIMSLIK